MKNPLYEFSLELGHKYNEAIESVLKKLSEAGIELSSIVITTFSNKLNSTYFYDMINKTYLPIR